MYILKSGSRGEAVAFTNVTAIIVVLIRHERMQEFKVQMVATYACAEG